jgi:hypothetical protein
MPPSDVVQFRLKPELVEKLDGLAGERGRNVFARDIVEAFLKGSPLRPVRILPKKGAEASGDAKVLLELVKSSEAGLTAREAAKKLDWAVARTSAAEHQLQDLRMIDYPDGQGVMRATEVEE